MGIRSSEYTNTEYRPFLEIVYINEDEDNFTFAHLTDVHLGANWVPGHRWSEEIGYPRFTDGLFEISKMTQKPDFLLVGGDIAEYAKQPWFLDYRSIVNGFYKQAGVPVYTVPGNHDRYVSAAGNALCAFSGNGFCEDDLEMYREILDRPGPDLDETNYLIPGDPFNFRFVYKGIEIIGLDTGGDFLADYELGDAKDGGPEGSGLTDAQINALTALESSAPKVVLTHHPVISGAKDPCAGYQCPSDLLEDGSFAHHHDGFLDFVAGKNVKLLLSGHTHNSVVYDSGGNEISEDSPERPLFIQTPSAAKDGKLKHGYRIISVDETEIRPAAARETGAYEKTVAQLSAGADLELRIHDPNQPADYITPADDSGFYRPFYAAAGTKRLIVYEPENAELISIKNSGGERRNYDLSLRREETLGVSATEEKRIGYLLSETTPALPASFASFHFNEPDRLAKLDFKGMKLNGEKTDRIELDWAEILSRQGVSGLTVNAAGENVNFERLPVSITASLASPAELRLTDEIGRVTGQVKGESREEIPLTIYETEYESATAYFYEDVSERPLFIEVAGLPDIFGLTEEEFGLTVTLDRLGADSFEFRAADIPIASGTVFRFGFDWEALERGEDGARISLDYNGDGVFEHSFFSGNEFSAADYNEQTPRAIKQSVLVKLPAIEATRPLVKYGIASAIGNIERSLNPAFWEDDFHLSAAGKKVFYYEKLAAGKLYFLAALGNILFKSEQQEEALAVIRKAADDLARADRILAEVMYRETIARLSAEMTAKQAALMALAKKKIDQGNAAANPLVAINFYEQAWELSREAE